MVGADAAAVDAVAVGGPLGEVAAAAVPLVDPGGVGALVEAATCHGFSVGCVGFVLREVFGGDHALGIWSLGRPGELAVAAVDDAGVDDVAGLYALGEGLRCLVGRLDCLGGRYGDAAWRRR